MRGSELAVVLRSVNYERKPMSVSHARITRWIGSHLIILLISQLLSASVRPLAAPTARRMVIGEAAMASAITATLAVRCRRASEFQHFDGYIGWLHWRLHPSLQGLKIRSVTWLANGARARPMRARFKLTVVLRSVNNERKPVSVSHVRLTARWIESFLEISLAILIIRQIWLSIKYG